MTIIIVTPQEVRGSIRRSVYRSQIKYEELAVLGLVPLYKTHHLVQLSFFVSLLWSLLSVSLSVIE